MPKIKMECTSTHSADETYKRVKTVLESDQDLRKMDSSYQCRFDEAGRHASAKGSKFSADLQVKDAGQGSTVSVEVELPLMLTPFKGMVETTLRKKLDRALGTT